jgi:hypothetical protein
MSWYSKAASHPIFGDQSTLETPLVLCCSPDVVVACSTRSSIGALETQIPDVVVFFKASHCKAAAKYSDCSSLILPIKNERCQVFKTEPFQITIINLAV